MSALAPVLSLLLAAPLAAQTFGAWKLASAPDLKAVFEEGTAAMNFIVRPIARHRLNKTNWAYQEIHIARGPGEISIRCDDRQPVRMPDDGRVVDWIREDGERFLVCARMDRDDLVQTYKAEDGERINVYHVDPGTGLMSLTVTLKSGKLPKPIIYILTYKAG